jgi:hypothetical protein
MATKLPNEEYLKYWEAADAEEIGIHITVEPEDQSKFLNALYDCRKAIGGYEHLIVMQPQPLGTVYVMKKPVELP